MGTGQWLTVQQVAERLQVRIETVRRWVRRGDIPVLEIGSPRTVYRIRQSDLDDFVRRRYQGTDSEPGGSADADEQVEPQPTADPPLTAIDNMPADMVEQMPAVMFREPQQNPGAPSFMSREIESILGYSVDDFLSDPDAWIGFVHPDDRQRVTDEMARTDATGEPFRMEYRMMHRDGSVAWVRVEAILIDNDGEGPCWEGVIVDVTERYQLEAALRRRQLQQETVADLGRMALDGATITALTEQAVKHVAAATNASEVVIYEVLPGGTSMAVRSRFSTRPSTHPSARPSRLESVDVDGEADSLSGYSFSSREPVVADSLAQETRFPASDLIDRLGWNSGASVAIPGRVRPFGVLTVFADVEHAFSAEDLLYLQSVGNIISTSVVQSDQHWLTVTDVAELLQVTEDTVRRWIRRMELPALSLGGARAGYRVYPSDLDRFIQHRLKRLK